MGSCNPSKATRVVCVHCALSAASTSQVMEHVIVETDRRERERTDGGRTTDARRVIDVISFPEEEEERSGLASISEREQFPVLAHSSEQHEERRTRYTKLDGSLPHVASLGRARAGGGRAKRTQQHILCTSKSKRHQGDAACALIAPTSAQLHCTSDEDEEE